MNMNNQNTEGIQRFEGNMGFPLEQVSIKNPYLQNAADKEIAYLLSFDVNRLIAGFRNTAGLDTLGVERYAGWESMLIGGHTLGHYITGCVQAYESYDTKESDQKNLVRKLEEILSGIKECQDAIGTGFIFGALVLDPNQIELQFDNVEEQKANIITQAWVPWYTMHKIMEGMISAAKLKPRVEGDQSIPDLALDIAKKLGNWVAKRAMGWSKETRRKVLSIEYGGMNDCMYDLYQITGDATYATAAHAFDQEELFERVRQGKTGDNILNNLHANTTIPKFQGALNRYLSLRNIDQEGASIYLEYAEKFWEMVVLDHTYLTGGNSEWEHFGEDQILDAERTNCTCETCNAYNMLKLTKKLFMITGEIKYADYYENTFLNSILSSQNPETGMTTYFQPMATGYFKVFGDPYTKFWCCTGTGMENFTKLGESIYYKKDDILIVNQYLSSDCHFKEYQVIIEQRTNIPSKEEVIFTVHMTKEQADFSIAFRRPNWLAEEMVIMMNEKQVIPKNISGYLLIEGPFVEGTVIKLILPMKIQAYSLPDNKRVFGFKYGPIVLSARLGKKDMEKTMTGVEVSIPNAWRIGAEYNSRESEQIVLKTDSVETYMKEISRHMIRLEGDELAFQLKDVEANLTFVPHFSQYKERYGLYWDFVTEEEILALEKSKSTQVDKDFVVLDTVQPGYGQYENDLLHDMKEYGSGSTGITDDGTYRFANIGGAFSYRMIVDRMHNNYLKLIVRKEDDGKMLRIRTNEHILYEKRVHSVSEEKELEIWIPISKEVVEECHENIKKDDRMVSVIPIIFEGAPGEVSARVCNFIYSLNILSLS